MRQKLEREKRLAIERRLAHEEKEKEYVRILQRQQKLLESKTERNELEYRRQREEVEREFRRREKEGAIKKREMAEDVAKARNVQLEEVVSIRFVTHGGRKFVESNPLITQPLSNASRNANARWKLRATRRTSRTS